MTFNQNAWLFYIDTWTHFQMQLMAAWIHLWYESFCGFSIWNASIWCMIGLCGTKIGRFTKFFKTYSVKLLFFENPIFLLMMQKLCEFWHYTISLLFNKLMEIISGTQRAFQIWAIMSRSWYITTNVLDIFFAPDLGQRI